MNYSSPVPKGARFTSGFRSKSRPNHAGDDWAPIVPGDRKTKIYAAADGVVRTVGRNIIAGHSGTAIRIDHGNLTDKYGTDHMESYYGHLASTSVKVGDIVKAGQVIGIMGATGNVTGIHLHFGVLCDGLWIAPTAWLERKGVTIGKDAPRTVSLPKTYTVRGGDTLGAIAKRNGKTVAQLLKLNPAIVKADPQGDKISVGQKVTLR